MMIKLASEAGKDCKLLYKKRKLKIEADYKTICKYCTQKQHAALISEMEGKLIARGKILPY
jgi:hypothetical protein